MPPQHNVQFTFIYPLPLGYIFTVYSLLSLYLWVTEESSWVEVVPAIPPRHGPLAVKHGLTPRLLNTDDAGVDEVTDVDVGEGIHEILERHPREKVYSFVNIQLYISFISFIFYILLQIHGMIIFCMTCFILIDIPRNQCRCV